MIKNPTPTQLLDIATWERRLMWSIVAMIAVNLLSQFIDPIIGLLALVIVVFQLFAIYKFATAAEVGWLKWLVMVLAFIPLIGLAAIVIMVVRVNKILRNLVSLWDLWGRKSNQYKTWLPNKAVEAIHSPACAHTHQHKAL